MKYHLDIQIIEQQHYVPNRFTFQRWVNEALTDKVDSAEICLRIVSREESQALNRQYRKKDKPTNVLSFSADIPDIPLQNPPLGDLVLCAAIIEEEAKQQDKGLDAHWAHMVVHGTLHLLGFDHAEQEQAKQMEAIEINILSRLGFANPYED